MTSKIMVVDDDTDIRFTIKEILEEEGRDVISAESGYQAIQFASDDRIALIIMDIQMPGINGVEAFLAIKEILPDCTVVMMTGYSVESLIEEALSQGAKMVLSKPFLIEQLLEIMEEVVPV